MKIETKSGYRIESDGTCITLFKKRINKKGQETWDTIGYYPRFSQALDRFADERIADSEAKTLEDLKGDLFAIHSETKKIVSDLAQEHQKKTV